MSQAWVEMEEVVAEAVLAERNRAEEHGELGAFFTDLKEASSDLFKLGGRENVDYSLARMGEAYALWYHMRRAANAYDALRSFADCLKPAFWQKTWRVLDTGSGTRGGEHGHHAMAC